MLKVRGFSPLISTEDSLSHWFTPARRLSPRTLQRGKGQSRWNIPFLAPPPAISVCLYQLCSYIHPFGADQWQEQSRWKSPPLPNSPGPSGSQDEDLTRSPESCPRRRTRGQAVPSLPWANALMQHGHAGCLWHSPFCKCWAASKPQRARGKPESGPGLPRACSWTLPGEPLPNTAVLSPRYPFQSQLGELWHFIRWGDLKCSSVLELL